MTTTIESGGLLYPGAGQPYVIIVDNDGHRFVNEATFQTSLVLWNGEYTVAYLNLPKRPRKAWLTADADGARALGWTADVFRNADPARSPYLDPRLVASASTLDDLAARMEAPAGNLAATVGRYNGLVAGGADTDFRRPGPLHRITTPPFYAARAVLIAHDQCGGIRVNARLQVIDQTLQAESGTGPSVALNDERVIPHLYAAGECAGGLYGADRGPGKIGSYLVQGRFAGRYAALEKPV
jgi:succinate dehydrogenase/fumarate reductase flavoprotein subunit